MVDHQVLDVMSVPAGGDPTTAVTPVGIPARMPEHECDVLVVGGGTGGVAAAIAASRLGMRTIMLEETDWIGGQLTTQGVSALDEHDFIESFGGTATYYRLRERIRDHYRRTYPGARDITDLNPGTSWVTHLAFEPRVALAVLWDLMRGPGGSSAVRVELRTKVVAADVRGDQIQGVVAFNFESRSYARYRFKRVVDATEQGDLLVHCGAELSVGAETRETTGEPHARSTAACSDCVQSFTYPAALRLAANGETGPGEAPPRYQEFRDRQPYSLRIHVTGGEVYSDRSGWLQYDVFDRLPGTKGGLWDYRRLLDHRFLGAPAQADISIINWPGNDYRDRSLLTMDPEGQAHALQAAKWVSQGFVHWLRTEAPGRNGSTGNPELTMAADVYDTSDGVAKYPYVRESRRIVPLRRIVESDVSAGTQSGAASAPMRDTVGVGWYPIDIHAAHPDELAVSLTTKPFQIPLGALVPVRLTNMLAGAKNIGTTHITNGCFRLHPIEWNIGEAAGTACAISIRNAASVQDLVGEPMLGQVQASLVAAGVPLAWITDVGVDDPAFAAVHLAAASGRFDPRDVGLQARRLSPAERRLLGLS
jgi:hypothetical protein